MRAAQRSMGLDLEIFNGDDSWTLPLPARFIIDGERTIQYAARIPDITIRTDPVDTLTALRRIVG